jgi:WD40 repeat protein
MFGTLGVLMNCNRSACLAIGALLVLLAGAANGEDAKAPRTDLYGDPLPPGAVARLGTVRLRHAGADVVFSKDGKHLISCGRDGEVRVWDAVTGKLVRRQRLAWKPREDERLITVTLSPGGTIAAAWDGKGETVFLYDTNTGKERGRIPSINITLPYLLMTFSADGKLLALQTRGHGREYIAQIWDVGALKKCQTLETPSEIQLSSVVFTSDGKRLAGIARIHERFGEDHFHLFLWDTATGTLMRTRKGLRRIDTDSVAFSPDGETLVMGGGTEAALRFLAADTLKDKARLTAPAAGPEDFISRPVFSPDGRRLAAVWGTRRAPEGACGGILWIPRQVLLWNLGQTKEPRRLPAGHEIPLSFAPDGKSLVCRKGGALRLYDAVSGHPLHDQPGHGQVELALAVSPDGKIVASGDHDGVVRLWDAATSKQLWRREGRDLFITDCIFSADGRRVAAGNLGGPSFTFQAWETVEGKALGRIEREKGMDCLHAAAISADGKRLRGVYSEENFHQAQTIAWDLASGKRLNQKPYRLKMRADLNNTIGEAHTAFAPDGERLTVWLGDRLGIEEVSTGCLLAKLPKGVGRPLDFSPDGRLLTAMMRPSKEDGPNFEGIEVRSLIEVASGEEIVQLDWKAPNKLAFTPDGRGMVVSDHKDLSVWDTDTGEKLHQTAWPDSIARKTNDLGYPYVPSLVALTGYRVAASMAEGDILVWGLEASIWSSRKPRRELGRKELESLWSDLAGDARRAYHAIHTLTAAPTQTIPFLGVRLRPTVVDSKRIEKLLADLGGDSFVAREAASRELTRLHYRVEPMLRRALESKPSLEMRRRLQAILAGPKRPLAEDVRALRAIAVLERIGTPEARCILEKLADGAACRETHEAQTALQRLKRQ